MGSKQSISIIQTADTQNHTLFLSNKDMKVAYQNLQNRRRNNYVHLVQLYSFQPQKTMCNQKHMLVCSVQKIKLLIELKQMSSLDCLDFIAGVMLGLLQIKQKFSLSGFPLTSKMMGLNSRGKVKIWFNQNFAALEPAPLQSIFPSSQVLIINEVFDIVQRSHIKRKYPQNIDNLKYKINQLSCPSFQKVASLIQRFFRKSYKTSEETIQTSFSRSISNGQSFLTQPKNQKLQKLIFKQENKENINKKTTRRSTDQDQNTFRTMISNNNSLSQIQKQAHQFCKAAYQKKTKQSLIITKTKQNRVLQPLIPIHSYKTIKKQKRMQITNEIQHTVLEQSLKQKGSIDQRFTFAQKQKNKYIQSQHLSTFSSVNCYSQYRQQQKDNDISLQQNQLFKKELEKMLPQLAKQISGHYRGMESQTNTPNNSTNQQLLSMSEIMSQVNQASQSAQNQSTPPSSLIQDFWLNSESNYQQQMLLQ